MKKYLVANWKSNKSAQQAATWLGQFEQLLIDYLFENEFSGELEVMVAPSYPLLPLVSSGLNRIQSQISAQDIAGLINLSLAAQDISQFPAGSYTGQVSVDNLKDLSLRSVILGHSERRNLLSETSKDVALKLEQALKFGLGAIVCIDKPYLQEQAAALGDINIDLASKLIIAYEPLAAIGSGQGETQEQVVQVVAQTRALFPQSPVLYGGSVKPENVKQYLMISDGVLVGGASLQADSFLQLIKQANEI